MLSVSQSSPKFFRSILVVAGGFPRSLLHEAFQYFQVGKHEPEVQSSQCHAEDRPSRPDTYQSFGILKITAHDVNDRIDFRILARNWLPKALLPGCAFYKPRYVHTNSMTAGVTFCGLVRMEGERIRGKRRRRHFIPDLMYKKKVNSKWIQRSTLPHQGIHLDNGENVSGVWDRHCILRCHRCDGDDAQDVCSFEGGQTRRRESQ